MVMISYFIGKDETPIDAEINRVLERMQAIEVENEKYPNMLDYLERLNKMQSSNKAPRVSRDTIAIIVGNLLGILLIIAYEQKHVITSRSFNQIIRPR
jgi:hypothetical protein